MKTTSYLRQLLILKDPEEGEGDIEGEIGLAITNVITNVITISFTRGITTIITLDITSDITTGSIKELNHTVIPDLEC